MKFEPGAETAPRDFGSVYRTAGGKDPCSTGCAGLGGPIAALVVVESKSPSPQLLAKSSILFPKAVDRLQLLLVHPAGYCETGGLRRQASLATAAAFNLALILRSPEGRKPRSPADQTVAPFCALWGLVAVFLQFSACTAGHLSSISRHDKVTVSRFVISRCPLP